MATWGIHDVSDHISYCRVQRDCEGLSDSILGCSRHRPHPTTFTNYTGCRDVMEFEDAVVRILDAENLKKQAIAMICLLGKKNMALPSLEIRLPESVQERLKNALVEFQGIGELPPNWEKVLWVCYGVVCGLERSKTLVWFQMRMVHPEWSRVLTEKKRTHRKKKNARRKKNKARRRESTVPPECAQE